MKLSWSHKLFFHINSFAGKNKWRDELMLICAHWLIYFLVILTVTWGEVTLTPELFKMYIKLLLTVFVFSIATNWLMALFLHHPRPSVEFKEAKELFQPYQRKKSFPSDHAVISFLLVFVTLMMGAPIWFVVLLFVLAWIVCFARVYTGVHYPRDIVGGFTVALVFSLLGFWLVNNITQPIYLIL
jgi:undecaprenyl-diphosphatase